MKTLKLYAALSTFTFMLGMTPAMADPSVSTTVAPDNSEVNVRDRSASEPTADQGSNQKSDLDIMAGIRKSVIADKSLSTYAHNVKIISVNGKVTLKGPVRSDDESKNIEAKANDVAGTGNVTNELSIKATR